jgi:hypothetical protein
LVFIAFLASHRSFTKDREPTTVKILPRRLPRLEEFKFRPSPSKAMAPIQQLRNFNRNFLFDLENGTIVHPFRLFAAL